MIPASPGMREIASFFCVFCAKEKRFFERLKLEIPLGHFVAVVFAASISFINHGDPPFCFVCQCSLHALPAKTFSILKTLVGAECFSFGRWILLSVPGHHLIIGMFVGEFEIIPNFILDDEKIVMWPVLLV